MLVHRVLKGVVRQISLDEQIDFQDVESNAVPPMTYRYRIEGRDFELDMLETVQRYRVCDVVEVRIIHEEPEAAS